MSFRNIINYNPPSVLEILLFFGVTNAYYWEKSKIAMLQVWNFTAKFKKQLKCDIQKCI